MTQTIADLHCDLLSYLANDLKRTPYDSISRCSITHMQEGGVKFQTLAVFAETGRQSVENGLMQLDIYARLPKLHPNELVHFSHEVDDTNKQIAISYAFEGASTFCTEEEPLQVGLNRLNVIRTRLGNPVYMSFTWNTENRFGGGALSTVGLKEDGKRLLDYMHQQRIAVDLSHASDQLGYDILHYIDQHQLNIPILASHSNSRPVTAVPRNLPDEIAQEIIKRGGIIGLNFYSPFVGINEDDFAKHIAHWLQLGAARQICFGADFFYEHDFVSTSRKEIKQLYVPNYENASCYGRLLQIIQRELQLTPEQIRGLASENFLRFRQQCLAVS